MGKRIGESSTTQIRVYKSDRDRINKIISLLQIEMRRKITTAQFINMLLNKLEKDVEYLEKKVVKNVK